MSEPAPGVVRLSRIIAWGALAVLLGACAVSMVMVRSERREMVEALVQTQAEGAPVEAPMAHRPGRLDGNPVGRVDPNRVINMRLRLPGVPVTDDEPEGIQ